MALFVSFAWQHGFGWRCMPDRDVLPINAEEVFEVVAEIRATLSEAHGCADADLGPVSPIAFTALPVVFNG